MSNQGWTVELDKIASDYIISQGASPAFKGYGGFKHSICTSINDESIHGIPRKVKLADGDIISIDIGVRYPKKNGMCTDSARTFAVGSISDSARDLIDTTRRSFYEGIRGLRAGAHVKEIGKRIEKFVDGRYGIIDSYFGHGIGRNLHEGALIPNFDIDDPSRTLSEKAFKAVDVILSEGDIICIEPMLNLGAKNIKLSKDGWTVVTADGQIAAHYENTLIIHKDRVEIVT